MIPRLEIPAAIVERARAGDRAAFGTIVERTKGTLYAFIRRSVGDADEAYDVLQNTFLSAWLGFAKFDPGRPLLPWLRTIALNKCRDHGRRALVRRLFLRANAGEPSVSGADDSAQDSRLDRLDRAIPMLPAVYRESLLLTAINGLSHVEAAEILKTSPKAVEMRVRRARQRLAKFLGEDTEG